jgi:phosphoserine phosphatase RsbU/P
MLWSSLTNVILLAGVTLAFYAGARAVMIANAKSETRSLAAQTARGLQATLDSVQVSGRTLAVSAAGVGREPFNLRSLLQATLAGDPDISGALLIIEPGAFKDKEPGFSWYLRRDANGLQEKSAESLGYDYKTMPWYLRTRLARTPWWSEPYQNPATGPEWFTTYNLPLHRAGDAPGLPAVGMVSVDVPISRLRAVVQSLPDDSGLQPALLSPGGMMVIDPDPAVQMKMTLPQFIARYRRSDLAPLSAAQGAPAMIDFEHVVPGTGEQRYTLAAPVADTGWRFALSASEAYILGGLNRATLWAAAIGLFGLLLSQLVIRRFSGLIARPIEDLTDSAQQFSQGAFDYPMGHTERVDEVGVMARAFDSARGSIKQQLDEIEDLGAARQKLDSELSIAREIQLAMLPAGRVFDGLHTQLDTFAILEPAKAVGGDFYTFFEHDEDTLWFVVGDVSDKGIPAALFMARSMTVLEGSARRGGSPSGALLNAARRLIEGNDTCMFATVVCGMIEEETGECLIASAGHEAPVLLRANGRREFLPVISGPPLGFEVADQYTVWSGRLGAGDTLLMYTDGITEAFDADEMAFGPDRLLAELSPRLGAEAQCRRLVQRVHEFTGDAAQSDDITVLAVKFLRSHGHEEA